jgi:hypothetical protein
MVTLYALCDPDNQDCVRYIGETITDPEVRLMRHIHASYSPKTPVAKGVRWLRKQGKRPLIVALACQLPDGHNWAEQELIRQWMILTGGMLLNLEHRGDNDGGSTKRQRTASRRRFDAVAVKAIKLCIELGHLEPPKDGEDWGRWLVPASKRSLKEFRKHRAGSLGSHECLRILTNGEVT